MKHVMRATVATLVVAGIFLALNLLGFALGLQGARIVALVGQRKATGVPQHVGVCLEAKLGRPPARSTSRAKPAVVNARHAPT